MDFAVYRLEILVFRPGLVFPWFRLESGCCCRLRGSIPFLLANQFERSRFGDLLSIRLGFLDVGSCRNVRGVDDSKMWEVLLSSVWRFEDSPGIFAACSFYLQCVFIVLDLLITFLFFSILCMAYSFYVLEFLFLPLSHCILHHNKSGNRGMCIEDVDFGCVCIFPCYV